MIAMQAPELASLCYNGPMASEADPYQVLGISRSAGLNDVRQAYRRAALKYHPDSRPADPAAAERRFHAVCEAYRTILATFGPAAVAGAFDQDRTNSPVDFARRQGGWRTGARPPGRPMDRRGWGYWPISQKVTLATCRETKVFVWFWALAVVVGAAVSCFAVELGPAGEALENPRVGDLLAAGATGIAVYLLALAGMIAAIVMTRKAVIMTVQFGLRLLPAPFHSRGRRRLDAKG